MAGPEAVAVQFNVAINSGNLVQLADLMTEDHRFIDTGGPVVAGKQACVDAWRRFFNALASTPTDQVKTMRHCHVTRQLHHRRETAHCDC